MTPEDDPNRQEPQRPQPLETPLEPLAQSPSSPSDTIQTEAPRPAPLLAISDEPSSAPFVPIILGDPPKPHSKRKWIIVAAAVLLVLIGSGSVFGLVYNNPNNAVADSILKTLTASSANADGSLSVFVQDQFDIKMGYSYQQSTANQYELSTNLEQKAGDKTYKLNATLVGDTNKTTYVKIAKLAELSDALLGEEAQAYLDKDSYDKLVSAIDGKWISISNKDIESFAGESSNKELECVQQKFVSLRTDTGQQSELRDLYLKHPFIVTEYKGVEVVNGAMTNHYVLKGDENQAKEFTRGLKDTGLFKSIDGCVKEDLAKGIDEQLKDDTSSKDSKAEETVDYWVNMWNHHPVKFKVGIKEDKDQTTFVADTKLNSNPTVTVPKADKSLSELKTEINNLVESVVSPNLGAEAETTTSLLPKSRDVERRTDVVSTATQLEVYFNDNGIYFAAADITEAGMLSQLPSIDPSALQAPGSNTFSFVSARSAGAQKPLLNQYVYQPLNEDKTLCVEEAGCFKFIIWWLDEATNEVKQKASLN